MPSSKFILCSAIVNPEIDCAQPDIQKLYGSLRNELLRWNHGTNFRVWKLLMSQGNMTNSVVHFHRDTEIGISKIFSPDSSKEHSPFGHFVTVLVLLKSGL